MSFWGKWGNALSRVAKAFYQLPAKEKRPVQPKLSPTAIRAREILATIRQGEYHFSDSDLNEIIRRNNWLGKWRKNFQSIELLPAQRLRVNSKLPLLGDTCIVLAVADVWHDARVSSVDFFIESISAQNGKSSWGWRIGERILRGFLFLALRWQGTWRYQALSFLSPVDRMIRVYIEWPQNRSPILENVNVIGVQTYKAGLILNTFRRPVTADAKHFISNQDPAAEKERSVWNRLEVLFSWLLLGAYAFVLIHVTLPVLDGAFRLMPQDAKAVHVWILKQAYNLLVILISYFFLRITMLPLYIKWSKSREELVTLMSLESRDHEYLKPLTEMVRKMQGKGTPNVPPETIAQMIDLMSTIRERSRRRLVGMSQMRRSWIQDLVVGYVFIFSLEWMYYLGYLTPLSVSIDWVNRVMIRLFLYE